MKSVSNVLMALVSYHSCQHRRCLGCAGAAPPGAMSLATAPAGKDSGRSAASSRFRGVTRHRRSGRWEAHLWVKDLAKQIYLGTRQSCCIRLPIGQLKLGAGYVRSGESLIRAFVLVVDQADLRARSARLRHTMWRF